MPSSDFIQHAEGGSYREVYRSTAVASSADNRGRSALTHTYFLLRSDEPGYAGRLELGSKPSRGIGNMDSALCRVRTKR